MSSIENNNSTSEKKIRFRPEAHILFNDNRYEEIYENTINNDQDSKKKGRKD